jgi:hypothetical protein
MKREENTVRRQYESERIARTSAILSDSKFVPSNLSHARLAQLPPQVIIIGGSAITAVFLLQIIISTAKIIRYL